MPKARLPEDRPCTGCGKTPPEVSFGRSGAQHEYRKSRCKTCWTKVSRDWQAAHHTRNQSPEVRAKNRACQRERYKTMQTAINAYKARRGCIDCGYSDPNHLQFHHRNPSDKLFTIGNRASSGVSKLEAEIEKCDVLCLACHMKLHRAA